MKCVLASDEDVKEQNEKRSNTSVPVVSHSKFFILTYLMSCLGICWGISK